MPETAAPNELPAFLARLEQQCEEAGARPDLMLSEAIASYNEAQASGKRTPEVFTNTAVAHMMEGNREAAKGAFREAARRGGRAVLVQMAQAEGKPTASNTAKQAASTEPQLLDASRGC